MSSAAKKAWATRRKLHPKWRKKQKYGKIKMRPLTEEERNAKPGQTIYYSTWEREMVNKHGPKWFLKKGRR
jgi:hypothetical protein